MTMKKRIFRFLTLLLTLCFVLSAFVACEHTDGGEGQQQNSHVCQHVCPQCGACKDPTCTDPACATKCQCNGHVCKHSCPLCAKCTNLECTDEVCKNKCTGEHDFIDYAASITLDLESDCKRIVDAQVRTMNGKVIGFIDGDTTHFTANGLNDEGILKARYLGVNTPESTGTIEQYGKRASNFTKNALANAQSIVIESEDENWNIDSTGGRYLVWIWYRNSASEPYRNLNIELLQRGLAIASNSANNKYGETCVAAINQAKQLKFNVYSGIKDPDYYKGSSIKITLKELRANPEYYNGKLVSVEGTVAYEAGQTVYLEAYDEESYMYIGMSCYYGFGADGGLLSLLKIGNYVRIVGTVSYYEAGGTYQISGLQYNVRKPTHPDYCGLISVGGAPAFQKIDAETFASGKRLITYVDWSVSEEGEEKTVTRSFAELAMSTSVSMDGLTVTKVYTTKNGNSAGAMTLTCKDSNGNIVSVRTDVLRDSDGNLITADTYKDKVINVKGVVDYYDGEYQIKVFEAKGITIVG